MSTCSRCGQSVEFRYVGGRCIPIHPFGGCSSGGGYSTRNDFTGYLSSNESSCSQTDCPECGERVFFIRHNGGSVWIDPPLGPPWFKHRCMDTGSSTKSNTRSSLASEYKLPASSRQDGLIVGVVIEAETSIFNEITLINVQTGEKDNFMLLIKNSAGFLVGRIVVIDPACTFVRWIEDEMYSFKILAPIKFPKTFTFPEDNTIECPECNTQLKSKNLAKHLRKMHSFMML
jgi:DNA-directed RNA polymerase subunit RPC12/RpoP